MLTGGSAAPGPTRPPDRLPAMGSPGEGHAGPGATTARRTGHPPVEHPPRQPGPERELEPEEVSIPTRVTEPHEEQATVKMPPRPARDRWPMPPALPRHRRGGGGEQCVLPGGPCMTAFRTQLDPIGTGRRFPTGPVARLRSGRLFLHRHPVQAHVFPAGPARSPLADGAGHHGHVEERAGQLAIGERPWRGWGVLEDGLPPAGASANRIDLRTGGCSTGIPYRASTSSMMCRACRCGRRTWWR